MSRRHVQGWSFLVRIKSGKNTNVCHGKREKCMFNPEMGNNTAGKMNGLEVQMTAWRDVRI